MASLEDQIEEHDDILNEYSKKTDKLELVVYGIDGTNGVRGKLKEHDDFIESIKPHLLKLQMIDEIKKNVVRIFWVLVLTGLLALGQKYIQIGIGEKNSEILNEVKTTIQEQHSEPYVR